MDMYESAARLYAAATKNGKQPRQSELARALNVSPQVLKNWEIRGLSIQGALIAETTFGVSPTWLLTGQWPAQSDRTLSPTTGLAAQEASAPWNITSKASSQALVDQLAQRLETLPEAAQRSAQSALSALAGAPDSKRAREALTRALDTKPVAA